MKVWKVTTRVYDNFTADFKVDIIESDVLPASHKIEKEKYDYYIDYFDSEKAAKIYMGEY